MVFFPLCVLLCVNRNKHWIVFNYRPLRASFGLLRKSFIWIINMFCRNMSYNKTTVTGYFLLCWAILYPLPVITGFTIAGCLHFWQLFWPRLLALFKIKASHRGGRGWGKPAKQRHPSLLLFLKLYCILLRRVWYGGSKCFHKTTKSTATPVILSQSGPVAYDAKKKKKYSYKNVLKKKRDRRIWIGNLLAVLLWMIDGEK